MRLVARVSIGLVVYMVFLAILMEIISEPDNDRRMMQYYMLQTRYFRRMAAFYGKKGIASELKYSELRDSIHNA